MFQELKRGWKDGLLACGGFLFLLASLFIPILQFIALWLLPLPFLLLKAKQPWSVTFIPFGLLVLLSLIYPVPFLICLFLFAWFSGSVMGYLFRKEETTGTDVVLGGLVAGLISSWVILLAGQLTFQLFTRLTDIWTQEWIETMSLMNASGLFAQPDEMVLPLTVAFPILLFMLIGPTSIATFLVARRWFIRDQLHDKSLPPFYEWRLPRIFFTAYLVLMILTLIPADDGVSGEWLSGFLYLMQILMVLQGCSFALFFLNRKRGHIPWGLYLLIIALVIPLSPFFMLLGFIDTGIDLRRHFDKR